MVFSLPWTDSLPIVAIRNPQSAIDMVFSLPWTDSLPIVAIRNPQSAIRNR
jgi:hypothetical protein